MRFFTAPSALFDALRLQVMQMLGLPNAKAEQPWPEGITSLGLCPHEYSPPEFEQLIDYALANGGSEITAEEYAALQPKPTFPV
jgi:hypothetical protein